MIVHDAFNNWDIEFSAIPAHRVNMSLAGECCGIYCKSCNGEIRWYKTGGDDYPTKWACDCEINISSAASAMGRKGGSSKSARKIAAVRENGKKGGRPKTKKEAINGAMQ